MLQFEFFNFHTCFSPGEGRRGSNPTETRNTARSTSCCNARWKLLLTEMYLVRSSCCSSFPGPILFYCAQARSESAAKRMQCARK